MSGVTTDPTLHVLLEQAKADWGPLLRGVLDAQATAARLLSGERIGESAGLLVEFVARTGWPVLAPASSMAARLVGAALLIGAGAIRGVDDATVPVGENVLLVDVVTAGGAGLRTVRERLLTAGAARVDLAVLQTLEPSDEDVHVLMPASPRLRLA
jgi:hypothetical protein